MKIDLGLELYLSNHRVPMLEESLASSLKISPLQGWDSNLIEEIGESFCAGIWINAAILIQEWLEINNP